MRFLVRIFFLFVFSLASQDSAGICKWVDEDGVTHYAEKCPEEVDGQNVEVDSGPSDAEAELARQRSEQMRNRRAERKQAELAEKDVREEERAAVVTNEAVNEEFCMEASLNLYKLNQDSPVYFDENQRLQFGKSQYSGSYQGERRYIEEEEREQLTTQWRDFVDQKCREDSKGESERRCRYWAESLVELQRVRENLDMQNELKKLISDNCRNVP